VTVTGIEGRRRVFPVGDLQAELRELRMYDEYEGALEGTPRLHRRFRLQQFDKQIAAAVGRYGLHVHDLEGIRADEAARVDVWLPAARTSARLTSDWRAAGVTGFGQTALWVVWFQDFTDDPFARLAEIVRPLDWRSLAHFEPDDSD
jgi:hypothetical protein